MAIVISCSSCSKEIRVPDEWYNKNEGKRMHCPYCKDTTSVMSSNPLPNKSTPRVLEQKPQAYNRTSLNKQDIPMSLIGKIFSKLSKNKPKLIGYSSAVVVIILIVIIISVVNSHETNKLKEGFKITTSKASSLVASKEYSKAYETYEKALELVKGKVAQLEISEDVNSIKEEMAKLKPLIAKENEQKKKISEEEEKQKKRIAEEERLSKIKTKISGGVWVIKGAGNSDILRGCKVYLCPVKLSTQQINNNLTSLLNECQKIIDMLKDRAQIYAQTAPEIMKSADALTKELDEIKNKMDEKTSEDAFIRNGLSELRSKKSDLKLELSKIGLDKTILEGNSDDNTDKLNAIKDNISAITNQVSAIDREIKGFEDRQQKVRDEKGILFEKYSSLSIEMAKIGDQAVNLKATSTMLEACMPLVPIFQQKIADIMEQKQNEQFISLFDIYQLQKNRTVLESMLFSVDQYTIIDNEQVFNDIITKPVIMESTTNIDGKYEFSNIQGGNYYIYSLYKSNFSAIEWLIPIEIKSDQPIEINLYNENASRIVNKENK